MIDRFLKAKHWQLFMLTYGIPILFQVVLMATLLSSISLENEPNPEMLFNYFKLFPIIMILFMGIYFGWFWSVAVGLDDKIPENLKLKLGRYKLFLLIPIIYILIFTIYMETMMNGLIFSGDEPNFAIFVLIIPFHLFSMFCLFYCLYFVAKTIKTAELQKEVRFGDFIGEFLLIWLFPIGIWIIQPRINKMIEENEGFID